MHPAPRVTTTDILAYKALHKFCSQECVDWAIGLLEQGRDGYCLTMLAGMSPPHDHFDLAHLRDRVLRELEVVEPSAAEAITQYISQRFSDALADTSSDEPLLNTVYFAYRLHFDQDREDLKEFSLLWWAYSDFYEYGEESSHYRHVATADDIINFMRKTAEKFVPEHPYVR